MLDCELCNYYKSEKLENRIKEHFCEVTGFEFKQHLEDYDIEYPCFNNNFDINKLKLVKPKETVNMSVILSQGWKFEYRKRHINLLKVE